MHVKGHNKRAKLNCGFTLVEIIAVIVVIVILGAVAMGIFGNMAGSAKDAVIDDFFRECQTIYAKMNYGDSSNGFQGTNTVAFTSYIEQPGFDQATASLNGSQLTISGIPVTFFKNQVTTVVIDYSAQTYNGLAPAAFFAQAKW